MKMIQWLIIISFSALSSCAIIDNAIPKYHQFLVVNESSHSICIKSFEKNHVIDSIFLRSNESFSKLVEERQFQNNPTVFGSLTVDSVVITNSQGKDIILKCNGRPLVESLIACPELENSIANMAYSGIGEEIRERADGKPIRFRYRISYDDSDFQ